MATSATSRKAYEVITEPQKVKNDTDDMLTVNTESSATATKKSKGIKIKKRWGNNKKGKADEARDEVEENTGASAVDTPAPTEQEEEERDGVSEQEPTGKKLEERIKDREDELLASKKASSSVRSPNLSIFSQVNNILPELDCLCSRVEKTQELCSPVMKEVTNELASIINDDEDESLLRENSTNGTYQEELSDTSWGKPYSALENNDVNGQGQALPTWLSREAICAGADKLDKLISCGSAAILNVIDKDSAARRAKDILSKEGFVKEVHSWPLTTRDANTKAVAVEHKVHMALEKAKKEYQHEKEISEMKIVAQGDELKHLEESLDREKQDNNMFSEEIAQLKKGISDAIARQQELDDEARLAKEDAESRINVKCEELKSLEEKLKFETMESTALNSQIANLKAEILATKNQIVSADEQAARVKEERDLQIQAQAEKIHKLESTNEVEHQLNLDLTSQLVQLKEELAKVRETKETDDSKKDAEVQRMEQVISDLKQEMRKSLKVDLENEKRFKEEEALMSALHNKIDQVNKEEASTLQEKHQHEEDDVVQELELPPPRNKKQKWLSKVGRLRSRLPVTKQVAMDSNSVSTRSSSPGVVADVSEGSVQEASVQEASVQEASVQEESITEESIQESQDDVPGSVQEASTKEESIKMPSIQESQDDVISTIVKEFSTFDCGTLESSVLGESTQAEYGNGYYSTSYSERNDTQSIETKSTTSEERNGWNNWWGLA